MIPVRLLDKAARVEWQLGVPEFSLLSCIAACSGNWNILSIERLASDVFPIFHANTPDGKRFFQASKRQVPPFSAKLVNPSVNLPNIQKNLID